MKRKRCYHCGKEFEIINNDSGNYICVDCAEETLKTEKAAREALEDFKNDWNK